MDKSFFVASVILIGIATGVATASAEPTDGTSASAEDLIVTIPALSGDGGDTFALSDGFAQKETPSQPGEPPWPPTTVRMVGEPVPGDAEGDGDPDEALLLVVDSGGSGRFYWAVIAINDDGSYQASNALPLGDRITPQTVEFRDGQFVYNYLGRTPDQGAAVPEIVFINLDTATGMISTS
ncbi:hypothetical protein [Mycolicibacterium sp.]|jgi:hypothetical protein|uniref:hypothetical protein n=1 Tax=Mycolicibacterium sp. TaxID=2320850 RepID=UPI001A28457A|nr:hypothetical protein [Mycolicibacterium sp.]MBJ7399103.1 hypothetical protein [Mycolicibacterium sp.]